MATGDGYDVWTIPVPGEYLDGVAYLDLETEKVPAPAGFRMRNGEPLRKRWSAFLAGVVWAGEIRIVERTGSEPMFLDGVREALGSADTVAYRATREFDEMILKGRFTNARRAHEPLPFFPALPGADDLTWDGRKPDGLEFEREEDCESRDVPWIWRMEPERREIVMIHLLRDLAELILFYGEPDAECEEWCARVLLDRGFARNAIYGGE
jgi:hypothetical protein